MFDKLKSRLAGITAVTSFIALEGCSTSDDIVFKEFSGPSVGAVNSAKDNGGFVTDGKVNNSTLDDNTNGLDSAVKIVTDVVWPVLTKDSSTAIENAVDMLTEDQKESLFERLEGPKHRVTKDRNPLFSPIAHTSEDTVVGFKGKNSVSDVASNLVRPLNNQQIEVATVNLTDIKKTNPVPQYEVVNRTLENMIQFGSVMYGLELDLTKDFKLNADGSYTFNFNDPLGKIPKTVTIPALTPIVERDDVMQQRVHLCAALEILFYHNGRDSYLDNTDINNNNRSFVKTGSLDMMYVKTRANAISNIFQNIRNDKGQEAMTAIGNNTSPLFYAKERQDALRDINQRFALLFEAGRDSNDNRVTPSMLTEEAVVNLANFLYMPRDFLGHLYGFPEGRDFAYEINFRSKPGVYARMGAFVRICRHAGIDFPDINVVINTDFDQAPEFYVKQGERLIHFDNKAILGFVKDNSKDIREGALSVRTESGYLTNVIQFKENNIPYFSNDSISSPDISSATMAVLFSALRALPLETSNEAERGSKTHPHIKVIDNLDLIQDSASKFGIRKSLSSIFREKLGLKKHVPLTSAQRKASVSETIKKSEDRKLMSKADYAKLSEYVPTQPTEIRKEMTVKFRQIMTDFDNASTSSERDALRARLKELFGDVIGSKENT